MNAPPQLFALISQTERIGSAELYPIAVACEIGARHCAEAYDVPAPAVEVFDDIKRIPERAFPVVFTEDVSDKGYLGVHFSNRTAVVYADSGSGLYNGRQSISETTSHEINESTINPDLNQWHVHPIKGVMVAREVCDMVQGSHYTVAVDGTAYPVANFVLPCWFRAGPLAAKYDYVGELSAPGTLGVGGYQILRNGDNVWHDWGGALAGAAPAPRPGSRHEALITAGADAPGVVD